MVSKFTEMMVIGGRSRLGQFHLQESILTGIRYNLTLHNKYNRRVFGHDNAHAVKPPKRKKFGGKRYEYDHLQKSAVDQGTPYEFSDCYTLLQDFFEGIDKTIAAIEGK